MNRFLEVSFGRDVSVRLLSGLVIMLVSFWELNYVWDGSVVIWKSDFKISRIAKGGGKNYIKVG